METYIKVPRKLKKKLKKRLLSNYKRHRKNIGMKDITFFAAHLYENGKWLLSYQLKGEAPIW